MKLLSLKIIVFCWLCGISTAVTAPQVEYVGEPPICQQEISRVLSHTSDLSEVQESLERTLRNFGYFTFHLTRSDSTLLIEAGPRHWLSELEIVGDSAASISVDLPFDQVAVTHWAKDILARYHTDGYHYAELRVLSVYGSKSEHRLKFEFSRGPRLVFNDYNLCGLVRSRRKSVLRFLPDSFGETLSPKLLNEVYSAAGEIEYLRLVGDVEVKPTPGFNGANLGLTFDEKKSAVFEGGLGYLADQDERLVWNMRLQLVNLFGEGRQADLQSTRPAEGRTLLDIMYRQPFFVFGTGQLTFNVMTRDFREQFYEFSFNTEYSWRLGHRLKGGVGVGWKRVDPVDSLGAYSRSLLGLNVSRSTIQPKVNPLRGSRLIWTASYTHRVYSDLPSESDVTFNDTRTSFLLERIQPLFGLVGHKFGFVYQSLISSEEEIPISELILIGGPGSAGKLGLKHGLSPLRGFRNQQFAVKSVVTVTLEPYLRFQSGRLSLFYDGAYLFEAAEEFYRFGFGIGMALIGQDRSLHLSLGWSRDVDFDQPRISIDIRSDI